MSARNVSLLTREIQFRKGKACLAANNPRLRAEGFACSNFILLETNSYDRN
jgi:hypothetical protein